MKTRIAAGTAGAALALSLWTALASAGLAQDRTEAALDEVFFRALPVHKLTVDRSIPEGAFDLVFRTAGRPDRPCLVFFHGITDSGFAWAGLARELSRDFHMILVDLPAYGDTFTPREIEFSYALQTARLKTLLETLGAAEGAVLVGHSTGGALAWHLSLEPGLKPAGLVLIDAVTVPYDLPGRARLGFDLARRYRVTGPLLNLIGPGTIAGIMARESASPGFRFSERSRRLTAAMLTTPARLRVNALWADQLLDFDIVRSWAPRLRDIAVPTLLVWGRLDTVLDWSFMEEARRQIPGARAYTVENAGHSPQVEKPAEVAERIRLFVRETGAAALSPAAAPEIRPVPPAEIPETPRELSGSLVHLTLAVSRYGSSGLADAVGLRLKRGYYSTDYPSQSGSVGLFLESLGKEAGQPLIAGLQLEMVWYKAGGFRFAHGWSIAGSAKAQTLTTLGYVPSYLPWVCLGARWLGGHPKAGFFVTLEMAPFLDKAFLFW
jgi:pimeloyl-ACP methyl ester carboxylesterase